MTRFFKGWLYRLWAFGGLVVVAAVVLYVGLNTKPRDAPPYATIGAAVGIYLVGLVVLQAIGISRGRPDDESETAPSLDPYRAPVSPQDLSAVLALPDGGSASRRHRKAQSDAYRFAWAQWIPMAAAAILLPLAGFLWVTGAVPGVWQPFGPAGIGIPVAALPGLAIVAVLFLLLPWTMRRARQISDDHHAPLGLSIAGTPDVILLPRVGTGGIGAHTVGPTTFAGQRYGRDVVVDAYAGSSAVLVRSAGPAYELSGRKDRLIATTTGPPAPVTDYLNALTPDPRLNRITVTSGPAGIRVDRSGSSLDQGWLFDLWLAERLAELQ